MTEPAFTDDTPLGKHAEDKPSGAIVGKLAFLTVSLLLIGYLLMFPLGRGGADGVNHTAVGKVWDEL